MKIVVLDAHGVNPGDLSWDGLKQFGDVTVYDDKVGEDETVRRIGDADIIVPCKTVISHTVLERCPKVKMISITSTGYDVIDVAAATERGIPVCNVPTYATDAVAQFTIALILELCHKIGDHNASVHRGDWAKCSDFCYWLTPQTELSGKTLGIIGYGNIGKKAAQIATALGMKVLYNSPHEKNSTPLGVLLAQSDIVSLNCRLTEQSRHIINAETIAQMKDGAWLVNTARGPVINERDVAAALNSGKLGGAAVDVVDGEPISPGNPLLSAKNCVITPHIAWCMKECRQQIIDTTVENISHYLTGQIQNQVN